MKLCEFMTDPSEFMDPEGMEDNECACDRRHKEKVPAPKKPDSDSNLEKARRIRTLAKMKAKATTAPENEDTPHSYNLGGHGSSFLFR